MQKLLLKDYDKIKKYLDDGNYEGYNSNFVTMMMWVINIRFIMK